ncbi:hypothetical protein QBC46DRAFT_374514 [Diplogelasinospora grovesii]|uniref:Alpha-1,3/1,6-mannosyltransferase ALG2 n=1 Tax=Diplogelasinospora grovesii TaxID=303347 RepID=A0AAN6NEX2_9PEZI|nr:hypothetical protein QBC46DRAFT_374514 [Diplogelasinospora grovesii]
MPDKDGRKKREKKQQQRTIVFLHPDLGIGGAERLVVDAAVGLQQHHGDRVVIFTSHCDPAHCFDEARDGTLDVRVRGNTIIPPAIFGRFAILCAILRQLHLILQIHLSGELSDLDPDAFFVDQLSAGLPLLKWLTGKPILFYCHFPDLLLARGRQKLWKRTYRVPFDAWEEWSMGFADSIAVNSGFTKGVVSRTWPDLARKKELEVVYPCINTKQTREKENQKEEDGEGTLWKDKKVLLSINRFERKKDVGLAIRAFAGIPPENRKGARLVIAGGYDLKVPENVHYHAELVALADSLGLKSATTKTVVTALNVPSDIDVLFLLSVPNALKEMLLRSARLLVYTPSNEHFGIVPLEAMLAGVPVLAANNGGPTETVVEGVTGWLRDPDDTQKWTDVMDNVLNDMTPDQREMTAREGKRRVLENFADVQMAKRLDDIFTEMGRGAGAGAGLAVGVVVVLLALVVGAVAGVIGVVYRL